MTPARRLSRTKPKPRSCIGHAKRMIPQNCGALRSRAAHEPPKMCLSEVIGLSGYLERWAALRVQPLVVFLSRYLKSSITPE